MSCRGLLPSHSATRLPRTDVQFYCSAFWKCYDPVYSCFCCEMWRLDNHKRSTISLCDSDWWVPCLCILPTLLQTYCSLSYNSTWRSYPRSQSDLVAAVNSEVAMTWELNWILFKAPVSLEKATLLSALQRWLFDQHQIRLISASRYLHCPWFDTSFRIILPRSTGRLAGLSRPDPVKSTGCHWMGTLEPGLGVFVSYTAGRGQPKCVVTAQLV